jgi:secondary-alkyl amine dehydrogenase [NAD(P)+]
MSVNKPRIVIYGTGQFGQLVTKMAVSKDWPIVAAVNRAGKKIGQDLGRITGLDRDLGIIIQDSETFDFTSLTADVAVVAINDRLSMNMPVYRKLMAAGINVICHGTESYYPPGIDDAITAELEQLGKAHGVSFTGTGIWDSTRIWAGKLVASTCTDITSLYHRSITDAQRTGKQLMLVVGVGMDQEEFAEKIGDKPGLVGGLYKTIPHQVLASLGYKVTRVTERREPVVFDHPVHCKLLERDLSPGECAGTRIVVEAETAQGVTARADIELRIFEEGEIENMMWSVEGLPSAKITFERDNSAYMSASSMFNRIPDVITAPPGLAVLSDLGMMRPTALA